jgi:alanine racemase
VTASAGRAAVTFRPTFAEVDLGSVRHNVRALRPDGVELMAVVKADGYGHGSVPVARAALEAGATWLGVALVEEGIVLRDAGIEAPILSALVAAAGAGGVGVHVKLDTGMHRVGLPPERTVAFVGDVIDGRLRFDGLWTHLATSEDLGDPFMGEQLGRFGAAVGALAAAGIPRPRYLHAANTGGVLAGPEAHLDLVRVGIGLYGVAPGPDVAGRADIRPVMAWTSRVAMTKRVAAGERLSYGLRYRLERASTIATVPVGYADGYSRRMSDGASVLIGGRRHPVAGTVTMDQILVDCGDAHVAPGDDVVLLGAQGHERISADEMASWTGTIAYEVLCGISERVPRTYADVGGAVVPMAPASGAAT